LAHIETLKRLEFKWKPYGGGNPYSYCEHCERSIIEGHSDDCLFYEHKKLINDLEVLVEFFDTAK
jgi:hypothetical protein